MCACMQKGCSVGARKWKAPFLFHSWNIPGSLALPPWTCGSTDLCQGQQWRCQEFPGEQKPRDWFCLLPASHPPAALPVIKGEAQWSTGAIFLNLSLQLRTKHKRMRQNSVKVPCKGRILHTKVLQKLHQFFGAFMLTHYQKCFLVTEFSLEKEGYDKLLYFY